MLDPSLSEAYYQRLSLNGHTIEGAVQFFQRMVVDGTDDGDRYFEKFGVGNTILFPTEPYERFACYEFLLRRLKERDGQKFSQLHKGTAYYFLAWTAFDIGDYERAIFYLDV